jgi:cytochrome P450
LDPEGGSNTTANLNSLDPPQHRQLRSLAAQAFTPRMVARLEPKITRLAHDLLDAVIDRGEMDVISDFAAPLPLIIIAEMLGMPASDHTQLREWSDASNAITTPAAMQARNMMGEYFHALVQQRAQQPGHDLISALLEAQIEGQHLASYEIVNLCRSILVAGNETTKSWIGNAMVCFDQYPDALAQVQAEPALLPTALEEVLRYLPPVPTFPRIAAVDTVIDEQEIKAGQWVIAHMGSANRDETQFPDPDTFDIRRNPNRHLTFGHGVHFCLGAPLARLEAKIALGVLFERLHEIERVPNIPLEGVLSPLGYGMKHLQITFKRKE